MPGCPAAVTETESPSQLMPSEIQRMCTSCTPGGLTGSVAMDGSSLRHQSLFEFERVDEQLLATEHVEREAATVRALQREVLEHADLAAVQAPPLGGDGLEHKLGAVERGPGGDEAERELQRRRHDLAQVPDLHLHAGDATARGVTLCDRNDGLGDRELVHQCLRPSTASSAWRADRRLWQGRREGGVAQLLPRPRTPPEAAI